MNLTPKQLRILEYIKNFNNEKGFAPTLAEIGKDMGVSSVTIFEHFDALERKGYITRRRHEARSVELVHKSKMFKHYKGGTYEFVCEGKHVDTSESFIVYKSSDGACWIRPKDNFYGKVMVEDVELDRFSEVKNKV